ncbi:hypothetical protein HPG69_015015, partial [Diceros bicornis minor]
MSLTTATVYKYLNLTNQVRLDLMFWVDIYITPEISVDKKLTYKLHPEDPRKAILIQRAIIIVK